MIPEIGNFALMMATAVALVLGTLPIVGAARGNLRWMALARPAARVIFLLVVGGLVPGGELPARRFLGGLRGHNSTHALPVPYKLAAFWGGHEGSMLLWLLILSFWMFAVSVFSTHLPREMIARILGVMGLIALGFLLFIILTSDPFVRMAAVPDGNDLNPLLQDPGMVAHPPMLYMAMSVSRSPSPSPSPRCSAATWTPPGRAGRALDDRGMDLPHDRHLPGQRLGLLHPGLGRLVVLGSGGKRLLHALAGRHGAHALAGRDRKARRLQVWTVLLAIFAFSLSLLGTFLVRSGVLTSVHAFASDPRRASSSCCSWAG